MPKIAANNLKQDATKGEKNNNFILCIPYLLLELKMMNAHSLTPVGLTETLHEGWRQ